MAQVHGVHVEVPSTRLMVMVSSSLDARYCVAFVVRGAWAGFLSAVDEIDADWKMRCIVISGPTSVQWAMACSRHTVTCSHAIVLDR